MGGFFFRRLWLPSLLILTLDERDDDMPLCERPSKDVSLSSCFIAACHAVSMKRASSPGHSSSQATLLSVSVAVTSDAVGEAFASSFSSSVFFC